MGTATGLVVTWDQPTALVAVVTGIGCLTALVALGLLAVAAAMSLPQTGYVLAARGAALGLAIAGAGVGLVAGGLPIAIRAWLARRRLATVRRAQRELWDLAHAPGP